MRVLKRNALLAFLALLCTSCYAAVRSEYPVSGYSSPYYYDPYPRSYYYYDPYPRSYYRSPGFSFFYYGGHKGPRDFDHYDRKRYGYSGGKRFGHYGKKGSDHFRGYRGSQGRGYGRGFHR